MSGRKVKKAKRSGRPLYHSAKISDYRFRKVLVSFVRDDSAIETARACGLSINSVAGIFRKLRVYFFEVGLLRDFYEGRDPLEESEPEDVRFEHDLLTFHLARVREKNGLKSPMSEPDYHFAESHWRYHFHVMASERADAPIQKMMLAYLLEIIRICGPVGTKPGNRRAGFLAVMRQMDQRMHGWKGILLVSDPGRGILYYGRYETCKKDRSFQKRPLSVR